MRNSFLLAMATVALIFAPATAQDSEVIGGQTNVLLNFKTLSTVGLEFSSVSSDVFVPVNLGNDSVAFNINPRNDNLATTFTYTPGTLSTFGGTIEHSGSVFFNKDTVEVGDFTIGYDANRISTEFSGFFVESTTGIKAILFDIENPSGLVATADTLEIAANLLVSPEFAAFLGDPNLAGVDVGDALVQASAIPEPSSIALFGLIGLAACFRRRK